MKLAVTWEMCGYVDVEADTVEEAMNKFNEDYDSIQLPTDAKYVDGSFSLSTDDVDDMKELISTRR